MIIKSMLELILSWTIKDLMILNSQRMNMDFKNMSQK